MKLLVESEPNRFDIAAWLPRIGVALFFIGVVGLDKLSPDPRGPWVKIFDQIGIGQWFRYLTGALQVAGGFLFLIPRTTTLGALILGSTLVGAIGANVFVLHTPTYSLFPAVVLAALAAAWFSTRRA